MAGFSFARNFNTARVFDVNTSGYKYFSLESLYKRDGEGTIYDVRGIYKNTKSNYSITYTIATDTCYINLPAHLNDVCESILNDNRAISAIKRGLVGMTIYSYIQQKYNKECYSINWVDLPEVQSQQAGEDMSG